MLRDYCVQGLPDGLIGERENKDNDRTFYCEYIFIKKKSESFVVHTLIWFCLSQLHITLN